MLNGGICKKKKWNVGERLIKYNVFIDDKEGIYVFF